MATTPPPITQFSGTAPQRGDRSTFSARVDAFVTWLIAAVVQLPALALNVYNNALEAFNSANTATSAAAAAVATANATLWISGATVQQYAAVISPTDGRTYRRTTAAGSGTTDPSADFTNYVLLSTTPTAYVPLASATVTTAVSNIDFLSIFTGAYDKYVLELEGFSPTGAGALVMRLAKAGVLDTTGAYAGATTDGTGITFANTTLTLFQDVLGLGVSGTVEVRNVNDTTGIKSIGVRGLAQGNTQILPRSAEGGYNGAAAVTGFRLYWSSGTTFAKGTIRIYGIKNS